MTNLELGRGAAGGPLGFCGFDISCDASVVMYLDGSLTPRVRLLLDVNRTKCVVVWYLLLARNRVRIVSASINVKKLGPEYYGAREFEYERTR